MSSSALPEPWATKVQVLTVTVPPVWRNTPVPLVPVFDRVRRFMFTEPPLIS